MNRLTREERLAAGWKERGWAVTCVTRTGSDVETRLWIRGNGLACSGTDDKSKRAVYPSLKLAYEAAHHWIDAQLVKVWSRPKAKAPALKTGDGVSLFAKVVTVSQPNGLYVDVKIGEQVITVEASLVR